MQRAGAWRSTASDGLAVRADHGSLSIETRRRRASQSLLGGGPRAASRRSYGARAPTRSPEVGATCGAPAKASAPDDRHGAARAPRPQSIARSASRCAWPDGGAAAHAACRPTAPASTMRCCAPASGCGRSLRTRLFSLAKLTSLRRSQTCFATSSFGFHSAPSWAGSNICTTWAACAAHALAGGSVADRQECVVDHSAQGRLLAVGAARAPGAGCQRAPALRQGAGARLSRTAGRPMPGRA